MTHRVDALPQGKHGDLRGCQWQKTGPCHWRITPPYTLEHLTDLEETLTRFQDQDNIVLGYLNTDIVQSQNPRIHQVV